MSRRDLRAAIDLGLASGRASTRKVAQQVMADRDDLAEALRLTRTDPDASIRRWAPTLETEGSRTSASLF